MTMFSFLSKIFSEFPSGFSSWFLSGHGAAHSMRKTTIRIVHPDGRVEERTVVEHAAATPEELAAQEEHMAAMEKHMAAIQKSMMANAEEMIKHANAMFGNLKDNER
jgi:hypothetical protein